MKKDHRGINPASKPSGDGCVECLASPKGWWFHLRRCAECGHIGCCDSSPSQHASKHAAATGHPIIASFEPGGDWFFDYEKPGMIKGVDYFRRTRIPKVSPHLDRQGEFQPIGNRCCTSWRRFIFYEWEQDALLFIGAVEESADMTRLVELRTSKRDRKHHLLHSISPQQIERRPLGCNDARS